MNNKLNNKNMNVKIDQEKCLGCGICARTCPTGIEIINNKAVIKDKNAKCLKNAADVCPIDIIEFHENEDKNIDSNQSEKIQDTNLELEKDKNQNTTFGRGQGGQGRGLEQNQNNGQKRGLGFGHGRGMGRGRK